MDRHRCRICSDRNSPTVDLFSISVQDHSLPYLIHRYLYFKVEEQDKFPQKICGLCFIRIIEIHNFAKFAAEIQEMFILLGGQENAKEPALLVEEGENTGTPAPPFNNEEITECSTPLAAKKTTDCPPKNYENIKSPGKTSVETMETMEENGCESGPGAKEIVATPELPNNVLTTYLESDNVNTRQQEEEVTTLNVSNEVEVTASTDYTSDDFIEVEGENAVNATEAEETGDTREPDNTPEENTEKENHNKLNQKRAISAKHSSNGKKIENRLLTKLQIFLYKCPYCEYNNSEKQLVEEHIYLHHNKTCNKTNISETISICNQPLHYHKVTQVGEERYYCKFCERGFLWQYRLENHYRLKHKDEKIFECEICDKTFLLKKSLKRHFLLHTKEKSNFPKCSVCKKIFPSKYVMETHMISMHKNTSHYKCGFCNRNISRKLNLQRHICTHLNQLKRAFKCEKCNKNFSNKSELRKHMLIHSDKMPYTCNLCKIDLVPNYKLYEHFEYQHEGNISVKCKICKKTFLTKDRLKIHLYRHEYAKLNICPICQKIFNKKRATLQHITKMHETTERLKYKCDICNKDITNKWNLILHIHSHLKQNNARYQCKLCNFCFSHKYSLQKHFLSLTHQTNVLCKKKKGG